MNVFNTVHVFSSFQPIQELREVVLNILQDPDRTTEGTTILYLNSFPPATQVKVIEEHIGGTKRLVIVSPLKCLLLLGFHGLPFWPSSLADSFLFYYYK